MNRFYRLCYSPSISIFLQIYSVVILLQIVLINIITLNIKLTLYHFNNKCAKQVEKGIIWISSYPFYHLDRCSIVSKICGTYPTFYLSLYGLLTVKVFYKVVKEEDGYNNF